MAVPLPNVFSGVGLKPMRGWSLWFRSLNRRTSPLIAPSFSPLRLFPRTILDAATTVRQASRQKDDAGKKNLARKSRTLINARPSPERDCRYGLVGGCCSGITAGVGGDVTGAVIDGELFNVVVEVPKANHASSAKPNTNSKP
jgi:hypothetical protein